MINNCVIIKEKGANMLMFESLSKEKRKEIISYIKRNKNEDAESIARRFNISKNKIELLKRKYLDKEQFRPGF